MSRRTQHGLVAAGIIVIVVLIIAGIARLTSENTTAPPTPPAPTAPAPLPPGTGVDGAGVQQTIPGAPTQVVPDIGPGAPGAQIAPAPEPGVGGIATVTSPAFTGRQRLNAGFYYPSGGWHGAWDVGISRGTRLYAARTGYIVARSGAPVPNHPNGNQYAIPGSPSNWILLCSKFTISGKTKWASLHYQHMSPGVKVATGQKVVGPTYDAAGNILKRGTYLGKSGNTGNSTGDHLHLSAQWSTRGGSAKCGTNDRYAYFQDQFRLFAPAKFWRMNPEWKKLPTVAAAPVAAACTRAGRAPGLPLVKKALKLTSTSTLCGGAVRKAVRGVQRGLKQPVTGTPTRTQLAKIGAGVFVVK